MHRDVCHMSCSLTSSLVPSSCDTSTLRESVVAFEVLSLLKHTCAYYKNMRCRATLCPGSWVSRDSLGRATKISRSCHMCGMAIAQQLNSLTGMPPKQWILDMAFQFQDDLVIYGASWQHLIVNTLGFSGAARHTCCRYGMESTYLAYATSLNPPPEPGSSDISLVSLSISLSVCQTVRHCLNTVSLFPIFTHGGSSRSSSRTPSLIWTPNPKGIQFSRSRRESLG